VARLGWVKGGVTCMHGQYDLGPGTGCKGKETNKAVLD
jgi:hypothetical protein